MKLEAAVTICRRGMPPCACSGPRPVCWCAQQVIEAEQMMRAAHIVARQLADLAAWRKAQEVT